MQKEKRRNTRCLNWIHNTTEDMIRFLQISDIHFTDTAGNDDEYRQMKCKFLEDIGERHKEMGKFDYILICGDIAFSGMENQYKKAREFISKICEILECDKGKVLVVPGNHDKKWDVYNKTRQMMRYSLLKGKSTKVLLESKVKEPMMIGILYAPFRQYYLFASEFPCISDVALKASAFPEADQKMEKMPKFIPDDAMFWTEQLNDMNGYKVYMHGSNSSLLSDKDDGESWNLKKGEHLQVLPLQAYNIITGNDEIHILMLHHPMSEITEGETIGKAIDGRFNIQLYGHVHKQSSSSDGVIKIYSGAFQPPEEENEEYFPVYNVIETDVVNLSGKPYLRVEVYSRKWNGVKFDEYSEETKIKEKALIVSLPQNEAWEKNTLEMKDGIVRSKDINKATKETESPHEVRHAFLISKKEPIIIREMYGNKFDAISPNRIKYITFLNQVEADNRIDELKDILKKYGK